MYKYAFICILVCTSALWQGFCIARQNVSVSISTHASIYTNVTNALG